MNTERVEKNTHTNTSDDMVKNNTKQKTDIYTHAKKMTRRAIQTETHILKDYYTGDSHRTLIELNMKTKLHNSVKGGATVRE